MKTYATLIILLLVVLVLPAKTIDPALTRLDRIVAERNTYASEKEGRIAHLGALAHEAAGETRLSLLDCLYEEYNGFDTDSALHYSRLLLDEANRLNDQLMAQRALIHVARCLAINGIYETAKEILLPLQAGLYEQNKADYYKVCSSMYIWEGLFTPIPELRQAAWDQVPALRDSTIRYEQSPLWRCQEEALLIGGTYPEGGIALLRPMMAGLAEDDPNVRYIANSLGSFYGALGQTDSALHYYALSAASDLSQGIREHASLREVALILFRQGDVDRAFRYMRSCIEDAELCKARLRTIEMATDVPFIMDAYQQEIEANSRMQRIGMIALLIFLAAISFSLLYSIRMTRRVRRAKRISDEARKQLKEGNERLEEALSSLSTTNQSLRASNRIRDTYVIQYMRECSDAIGKLERYQQQLLRVANRESYQKLQDAIRSSEFIDSNTREFYHHFDETFLSLFPHFVDELNALLRPEERFPAPQQNHLSTELRIFALIRLGISDSEAIAHFLRLSTKTVFNYRARTRNRAIADRDHLESIVMQLD